MTDVIIAQTCTVRGKVTTDHDGEAASFAIVSIQNLEQRTICDIDGRFELRNIPTGKHTIEVECLGFVKLKQQFTAIKDTSLKLKLQSSTFALPEFEVMAKKSRIFEVSLCHFVTFGHKKAARFTTNRLLPYSY